MTKHEGQFKSGKLHPRYVDDKKRMTELKQLDIGTLSILRASQQRGKYRTVIVHCSVCKKTKMVPETNLLGRKTTNCKCQRGKKYHREEELVFGERYDAIIQRCNNRKNQNYKNYGGRGIECEFINRKQFIDYMMLQLDDRHLRKLEIDRIDTNGNYAVGNLRLVSKQENLRNKRGQYRVEYKGRMIKAAELYDRLKTDYPEFSLSRSTTGRLARAKNNWREILKRKGRN